MRRLLLVMLGVLFMCTQLLAQNRTITGRVTDSQGAPIPGVSVVVKGTSTGTTTNSDGTFTLSVPEKAKTLIFSSVGMETNEVFIGSGLQFNTQLRPAANDLAEVVVSVPYGTVKKTAFTGSESTINSGALKKQQVTSVTKALEGLIPGIVTTNGGGAPGSDASVLIRGVGSYQGSSAPLYVLDGVPYAGSISALSMDDIESVTVLKDAAASALYGSRAANGVIMITTKKGRRGRSNISATYRQGFESRAIPEYDRVGPKDYYELMWEATRNKYIFSGQTPAQAGQSASAQLTSSTGLVYNAYNVPGAQLVDPVTGKLNPNAQLLYNESWEDALFRTAARENANVSISGGADKSDYFFSAGYLNEEGMARFTGLKRYNTRLNLNTQANDWLKAGISIDGSVGNTSNLLATGTYTTNPFYYARMMGPIYPIYQHDATGAYVLGPDGQPALDWGVPSQMGARPYSPNSNLVGSLALDDRSDRTLNGNANAYLDISFLKNFSFKTTMGTNYYDDYATTYQNSQYGDAQNVRGRSTKTTTRQLSYTLNEVLTWNKKFGDHNLRVLAGHENYYLNINSANATRIGFPFPGTTELNTAATSESSGSYEDNLRMESYFTGVNYSYKDKYLASASYRRDGTSRFAADNRWGNFYSAGLGWRISQEEFLKNVSWINELKLKASYGETGNQALYDANGNPIYYAYQNLYTLGYNNVNNPGAIVGAPSNPALVWEGNKQLNIGTDFTILKNRLQGSFEWFNRVSDNLLFGVPVPASTGYSPAQINENIGALKNTGVELQLGYNAIRQKNFDWRIDLNLTHFKNEFTKLPPGQTEIISGSKKIMVGHSIYDFWIKEYAGVDAATGDALFYQDVLGTDGKPTGKRVLTNNYSKASYYYEGSAIPDLTGGLTNSFRYGNFDLSFLLTFSYGGKFYDQNFQALMHAGSYGTAWATEILNRWQKPGDVTNVPRLQNAVANQDGTSTRWLFDASWLNVKNVTLSYNLSRSLASRMRVSGVQIFGNIDNAYLFTSHKGMDPQRSFTGTSDWSYAPVRTVTFGLNVNL